MTTSPTLALTLMTASQAQKEVLFNEFLLAFDSLYRGVVISSTLTSPPGSPSEGDSYIIGASPTGAWSGQANNITFYFNGWQFVTAKNQMRLYDEGSSCWRVYHSGSGTWDAEPASTVSVLNDLINVEGTPTDGQVLTYRTSDSHWKPQTPVGDGPSFLGVNAQTASYTLALTDAGKIVTINNASANALTVPPNSSVAFPVDTVLEIEQLGAGVTTITAGAGVTIHALGGTLALAGQYATARLIKTGTDTWTAVLSGSAVAGALASLSDTSITTGSGVDGYVVYWNNTAGKFELKTAGGGTLATLTDVSLSSPADKQVLYYNAGASKWENESLTALIDAALGSTQGDILYRGASAWAVLAPGTSGYVLTSGGSGANPSWASGGGGGSSTLATLTDVNVTEGSGIDGYVLKWNNATSKWIASASGGGGASALSGLSDVTLSSPSVGQLLEYNGSAWVNYNPPTYDRGPFAPPTASWFVTTPSSSGTSISLTNYSTRGMNISSASGYYNQMAVAVRDPSAWGSSWTVVARMVGSVRHNNYPSWGLMLIDTSGKCQGVSTSYSTSSASQTVNYDFRLNGINNNFNAIEQATNVPDPPEWFKIHCDGTNYYFATSYDGINWETYSSTVSSFLGTLAYVGISVCMFQNTSVVGGSGGGPANTGGVLVTYYSDPDHSGPSLTL